MYFLYQKNNVLLISRKTARELGFAHELLSRFHKIQDCISYIGKYYAGISYVTDATVKSIHHGHTPEGKQRIAEAKRNDNPNKYGLSEEHKRKISESMKLVRKHTVHPMQDRKHRPMSKAKTGDTMRKSWKKDPKIWVVSPEGKEYRVSKSFVLPEGWSRGRSRKPYMRL